MTEGKSHGSGYEKYVNVRTLSVAVAAFLVILAIPMPSSMRDVAVEYAWGEDRVRTFLAGELFDRPFREVDQWQAMTVVVLDSNMRQGALTRRVALRRDERAIRGLGLEAPAEHVTVGLMGLGVLGRACADALRPLGYRLRGWSRRARTVEGVEVFAGPDRVSAFLDGLDILVCLLPLTDETRGLINQETLARLAPGAAVLNAARGQHIVDADLLAALESGHVSRAVLDVFDPEPLPDDHPFWTHPRVILTPHIAAETLVEPACDQVARTIDRLDRGDPPPSVDRQAGY